MPPRARTKRRATRKLAAKPKAVKPPAQNRSTGRLLPIQRSVRPHKILKIGPAQVVFLLSREKIGTHEFFLHGGPRIKSEGDKPGEQTLAAHARGSLAAVRRMETHNHHSIDVHYLGRTMDAQSIELTHSYDPAKRAYTRLHQPHALDMRSLSQRDEVNLPLVANQSIDLNRRASNKPVARGH